VAVFIQAATAGVDARYGRSGRMAGYLDHYGEGDERKSKIIKTVVLSILAILVVGGTLFFFFRNYREERRAKNFYELLQKGDFAAAYELWGCSVQNPCVEYPFQAFMEDWKPKQELARNYRIARSRSCGSGVVLTIDYGNDQREFLWVEKRDLHIGFSPYQGCPNI
jgi:hypothetical protein